ncbi:MAG: DUF2752 domain-containing protein [Roseburia sp.]
MEKKKTSTAMDNGLYITGWCIIGTLLLLVLFIKATNIQLSKYLFPCVLHSLTGLYCPGCGGTRADSFFTAWGFPALTGLSSLCAICLCALHLVYDFPDY